MHEMTIAMSILGIATEYAEKAQAKIVREVKIEVGSFSGINEGALEVAFYEITKNTMLEGVKANIIHIEGKGRCEECGDEFKVQTLLTECPSCGSYNVTLINGKEVNVRSIIVD